MKSKIIFFLSFLSTNLIHTEQNSAFYTIAQKDTKALDQFLKTAPSDIVNEEGQTLLHAAVLANNAKAVKMILKSNSENINQLDNHGKTAMDYAVEYGHKKILKKLYKQDGKVTSFENIQHAYKIISRPYKAAFFIGLCIFTIGACLFLCAPFIGIGCDILLSVGLLYMSIGIIPTSIGETGLKYHSKKNILLS